MEINIKNKRVEITTRSGLLRFEEYKEIFEDILREEDIKITDNNLKQLARVVADRLDLERIELEFERVIDNLDINKKDFN